MTTVEGLCNVRCTTTNKKTPLRADVTDLLVITCIFFQLLQRHLACMTVFFLLPKHQDFPEIPLFFSGEGKKSLHENSLDEAKEQQ